MRTQVLRVLGHDDLEQVVGGVRGGVKVPGDYVNGRCGTRNCLEV